MSYTEAESVANHGHPVWEAIWQAIKGWDIERAPGAGLAHATGDDVQHIFNAIQGIPPARPPIGGRCASTIYPNAAGEGRCVLPVGHGGHHVYDGVFETAHRVGGA